MQQIDPQIQQLIEDGRQTAEAQEAERQQKAQVKAAQERQEWEAAWDALETAVAEQLPQEIQQYANTVRKKFPRKPDSYTGVHINIPTLALVVAYFQLQRDGWSLLKYHTYVQNVAGNAQDASAFNDLRLCLAHAAKLAERQSARTIVIREYQTAVNQWHKQHEAVTAVHEAMTHTLQQQICEHYGDSFALWQVHYAYLEGGEAHTDTAAVLENEPNPLGYWRVVRKWDGEVTLMAYANVFAVESLGDFSVRSGSYTIRLYGDDSGLGTIYLPPYLTPDEIIMAEAIHAEAIEKAPDLPAQPHPRTFEGAELFEEWELDWLYHSTQGGDATESTSS